MEQKQIQKNYNIELEQCILGFIILNHELIIEKGWIAKIKEYFFYEILHQKIFREIVERVKNEYSLDSKIINFNEIFTEIEEAKNYLSVLLKIGAGFVDFKEAVKELQELYALREIEKLTHNSNLRGDELRIKIEEIKEKITREETDTIESVSQTVAERLFEIENNKDVDNFIKTDFLDFDRSFGGLPKGQVSLLAGSPSMGKSTCALQIAINVARQGKNVLFFSQEMGKNEINNKIISNLYKIDGFRITCNNLYPSEIEMIKDGKLINEISTLNIDYSTSIDADIINRKIIEYKLKFKKDVDLVIIDHLHIMRDFKKSNNRNEELGNITKDVKNIAKNKNIAILLLSQLSRKDKTQIKGHKNYRPDLIDIRESGNIEANCDLIIFIHRPEYYVERDMQGLQGEELKYSQELLKQLKGQTYLLIKKNRNGICKDIQIFFEGNYSLFRDLRGDENGSY